MQQAEDFREVCEQLNALLTNLEVNDFARKTGFKEWTIADIVRHLYVWNRAALLSMTAPDEFGAFVSSMTPDLRNGGIRNFESNYVGKVEPGELLRSWRGSCLEVATISSAFDPSKRVPWAGPDMSARSLITSRIMETWAHAQAIYDELGLQRESTDGIRNIVVIGFNTYGWTFANRGLEVPQPVPMLVLQGPSGAIWRHGEGGHEERIEGLAEEFCQVVTQTRNIADTGLAVTGENARKWMEMAQSFAGPPQDPPSPGTRIKRTR